MLLWAGYAARAGFFGGAVFAQRPLLGMLAAFVIVLCAFGTVELARRVPHRRPDRVSPRRLSLEHGDEAGAR